MGRYFPGANGNYLDAGDAADVTGTALTVAAWVCHIKSNGVLDSLVDKTNASPDASQYRLCIGSTRKIDFTIFDGTIAQFDQALGATTLPLASWVHLCGRKSGTGANAMRVFLNGVSDGSATSNRSIQNTPRPLRFGNRDANDTPYNGLLAEIGIWNVGLSDAEILQLATKPARPSDVQINSLQGYWPLCGATLPEPDLAKGNTASQTGAVTSADHPFFDRQSCFTEALTAPARGRMTRGAVR